MTHLRRDLISIPFLRAATQQGTFPSVPSYSVVFLVDTHDHPAAVSLP